MKQSLKLGMRIKKQPIDICPLCEKIVDSRKKSSYEAVKKNGKMIFFAHKECLIIFDEFMQKVGVNWHGHN